MMKNIQTKYLLLVAIVGAIVALDQATKMYVHLKFAHGESIEVIGGFFNFTYVRNPGAAFGFLAQSHPEFRETFFLLLPPAAMAVIIWLLRAVHNTDKLQILALSMVFGGALGNYIDRVRFRYVIDFLDFHYQSKYSFPAFNVADSAIVVGISVLLLIGYLRKEEPVGEQTKTQETGA